MINSLSPGEQFNENKIDVKTQMDEIFYEIIDNREVKKKTVSDEISEALDVVLNSFSNTEANIEDLYKASNRVFGPVNRIEGSDCISNPNLPGPCRMLECICKEEYYNVFNVIENQIIDKRYNNWFIGKCQICLKKIRDLSHSIRFPEENGGWSGCYCSFDCLKEDIDNMTMNDNVLSKFEKMQDSIFSDGIMDRNKC